MIPIKVVKSVNYKKLDYKLQQEQVEQQTKTNKDLQENTRLTKIALWVAIVFGILQLFAQVFSTFLWH